MVFTIDEVLNGKINVEISGSILLEGVELTLNNKPLIIKLPKFKVEKLVYEEMREELTSTNRKLKYHIFKQEWYTSDKNTYYKIFNIHKYLTELVPKYNIMSNIYQYNENELFMITISKPLMQKDKILFNKWSYENKFINSYETIYKPKKNCQDVYVELVVDFSRLILNLEKCNIATVTLTLYTSPQTLLDKSSNFVAKSKDKKYRDKILNQVPIDIKKHINKFI